MFIDLIALVLSVKIISKPGITHTPTKPSLTQKCSAKEKFCPMENIKYPDSQIICPMCDHILWVPLFCEHHCQCHIL